VNSRSGAAQNRRTKAFLFEPHAGNGHKVVRPNKFHDVMGGNGNVAVGTFLAPALAALDAEG